LSKKHYFLLPEEWILPITEALTPIPRKKMRKLLRKIENILLQKFRDFCFCDLFETKTVICSLFILSRIQALKILENKFVEFLFLNAIFGTAKFQKNMFALFVLINIK